MFAPRMRMASVLNQRALAWLILRSRTLAFTGDQVPTTHTAVADGWVHSPSECRAPTISSSAHADHHKRAVYHETIDGCALRHGLASGPSHKPISDDLDGCTGNRWLRRWAWQAAAIHPGHTAEESIDDRATVLVGDVHGLNLRQCCGLRLGPLLAVDHIDDRTVLVLESQVLQALANRIPNAVLVPVCTRGAGSEWAFEAARWAGGVRVR